jgi:hypothetical protein
MQRTIMEEEAAVGRIRNEPEILQSIRTDARIRSIVILRNAKLSAKHPHDLGKETSVELAGPNKHVADSFRVTDLLEDVTYLVGQSGPLSLIVFTLKDERIMVGVRTGSDLTEIALDFARHLEDIRINT